MIYSKVPLPSLNEIGKKSPGIGSEVSRLI